jgi:hypothetical protein
MGRWEMENTLDMVQINETSTKDHHFGNLVCINRTEKTIGQHFYLPKMRDQITKDVSACTICQTQKKQSKKYGLLLRKKLECNHGNDCVDLIGPYNIKSNVKGVKDIPCSFVMCYDDSPSNWLVQNQAIQ